MIWFDDGQYCRKRFHWMTSQWAAANMILHWRKVKQLRGKIKVHLGLNTALLIITQYCREHIIQLDKIIIWPHNRHPAHRPCWSCILFCLVYFGEYHWQYYNRVLFKSGKLARQCWKTVSGSNTCNLWTPSEIVTISCYSAIQGSVIALA